FYINDVNAYPASYGPVDSANIVAGWSIDYASSNPSFLVGIADWWGREESGYSTDGGRTWTPFATEIPGAGSSFIGGTIAASSTTNFIWAPAGRNQPYYTTNGGQTWSPVSLPGNPSLANFDWAYYLDTRTVTADRVLSNTFYLYDPGYGVYKSSNGGATWSLVYNGNNGFGSQFNGYLVPFSVYNNELMSVPGEASNLFFTGGWQSGDTSTNKFMRSSDG